MTIGQRIRALREARGLTQAELAARLGVSDKAVSTWENDTYTPRMGAIRGLAEYFAVSRAYLLGDAPEPLPDYPNIVPLRRVRVPILGTAAAGEPLPGDEAHAEYVDAEADAPRCDFGLRVLSDSMEPTIRPGDLVFIRRQEDVDDGQIAAVQLDDGVELKRVYHMPGGLQLLSENAAKYPPRLVTGGECGEIRVLGLAVACRRDL